MWEVVRLITLSVNLLELGTPNWPRTHRIVLRLTGLSLAGRRLPQFYLVSFRIDDPSKRSILGLVNLLENVAAFFAQNFD